MTGPVVLHVAPHPDDELIGAPATLMALRDAGWRVVNLACSLGRPDQIERRGDELAEACRRARFELELSPTLLGDPLGPSDIGPAQDVIARVVAEVVDRLQPQIVVAPQPHDRHPGHEAVARGVVHALRRLALSDQPVQPVPRLWLWGLWADLATPTLMTAFDERRLDDILGALSAHRGEMERNDYRRLVRGRAEMNASLGPERVFGFGMSATDAIADEQLAELLTELHLVDGRWCLGTPRVLDSAAPLAGSPGGDASSWVDS